MEPMWRLEENATTGLQFWARLDRSPEKRSVRFKRDVEVREYLIVNDKKEPHDEPATYWTSSFSGLETYRIAEYTDNELRPTLLVASITVIFLTVTYKWWMLLL